MIRGRLWQKQKRTPVCSLCLYRTGLRAASRRAYSSSSEAVAWSEPAESRQSQPPHHADNNGSAARPDGAGAGSGGSTGWGAGGWGATSLQGTGPSATTQQTTWGNSGPSSWGSPSNAESGSSATGSTFQLSASELAAKERLANLAKRKAAPPPIPTVQKQINPFSRHPPPTMRQPSTSRPPPASARTPDYMGSRERQDQPFYNNKDRYGPLDIKDTVPRPPRFIRDDGGRGQLKPQSDPFQRAQPFQRAEPFQRAQPFQRAEPFQRAGPFQRAEPFQNTPGPPPPSRQPATARTLDYIGALGRPDQPFPKKDDPYAPLDFMDSAPRPPKPTQVSLRSKLGLDEGDWGQLKSQAQPFQKGPPSSPLSQTPAKTTGQNAAEFWTRAQDKFPSVEPPVDASTRITRPTPTQSTAPASDDAWKQMDAIAKAPSKAEPVAQVVDDSAWDWANEIPDKATKEAEERPWAHNEPHEHRQREPKPKVPVFVHPDLHDTAEPRGLRDRGRRDRHDHVEREEKGGRGKRREVAEPAHDDFDEESFAEKRRRRAERKAEKERQKQQAAEEAPPQTILLPELISVANLGAALGVRTKDFIIQMGELGFENITKDNILTGETAALVAQEYGFEAQVDMGEDWDLKPRPPPEDPTSLPLRPPVVTIMGHVDHGKTTLLDYLRKSSIVDGEHGGITQHIGAFSVKLSSGNPITFLDTPGHAAFLSMRQRGANVTDMVILVVAADDSVKPQTIEALKHARAAKVPMIVAINKVDKESANIDRVKSDLVANGVEIEDYGGDVQVVCVSGKTGQGMEDLEENILLLAEMLDIRSETDGMAEGWVLESTIKPIGRVATVLVKRGTLRPGDAIVAGSVAARIRTLRNEAGQEVDEAPPGTAVEILGWKDPPNAGDQVLQAPSEDKAKRAAHYRQELKERHEAVALQTKQDQDRRDKATEEEERALKEADGEGEEGADAEPKEASTTIVNFIIKGDVHGSVEACCASVLAIGNNEVRPRVLLSGPGQITEWEVEHASVSGSRIINFNNAIPGHIRRQADDAGVTILDHNIIYHMAEDVRDTLSGYLTPTVVTKVLGEIEVLQIFQINTHGRVYKPIAGCKVRNGQVLRKCQVRVMRDNEEIWKGTIDALKQGKKDATEVKKGSECGISFNGDWADFRQGDIIQPIEEVSQKRHL